MARGAAGMSNPVGLSPEERAGIDAGLWFASLSEPLRRDVLGCAKVKRLGDGEVLTTRGSAAAQWCGVARGAVRIGTVSLSGKQITLTYAEPGTWFGDIALFDGLPRTHDANAHGPTTLLVVNKADFRQLLERHTELYEALLRLNCRRLRLMFDHFEVLNTQGLQARLARQLLLLARAYGVTEGQEVRIGLQLAQEDIAQLLGASRQRVNQELKGLERAGVLRIEPTRLAVLSRTRLLQMAKG
jgi:CRP-like cAMP-binding protein